MHLSRKAKKKGEMPEMPTDEKYTLSPSGRSLFCLVIPTYNEAQNIGVLIDRLEKLRPSLPFEFMILVVDDNSRDGTIEVVKRQMETYDNVKLLQRPEALGIGSAYIDGFALALSRYNADYLGEMDADLQHPPEVLLEMCTMSARGVDVVLASRYVEGGSVGDWSFGRWMISKAANLLSKLFLRLPVKDATTGYRVLSARAIRSLMNVEVSSKGYSFQVESLYAYKKYGMSFAEVPFVFSVRTSGKTKLGKREILQFATVTIRTGLLGLRNRKQEPEKKPQSIAQESRIITK